MRDIARKRQKTKEWTLKNPKRVWAGAAVKSAKHRIKGKEIPFNLTIDYIESILPDSCPIFNTEFKWAGNKKTIDTSPTLDRIIPTKGYVIGNVVVISCKANNIKSAYMSTDIFKVAEWLQTIENQG
jgi:hypothetical protein